MDKKTSKNNDLFYSVFSGINIILKIIFICAIMVACVYIYDTIQYSGIKEELYAQDYIDYTVDIKELNENESLVEVYVENKGTKLVSFYSNALAIYKYTNSGNNVYKTNKIATINLLNDDNEICRFDMNGVSCAKIQFKVPKELTTEEYKIDFNSIIILQDRWDEYEDYMYAVETEAKINNIEN